MLRPSSVRLLVVLWMACFSASAWAAPGDAAARKKIDEAVTRHYLATDFDQAESVLTGAISACKGQCSPSVVARAWMYVGVVRGSGKNDQKGAKAAFANALAADPKIALDDALATQQTKKTFAAAQRDKKAGVGIVPNVDPAPSGGEDGDGDGGPAGTMECTPKVTEIETRRPIPVSCTTDTEASKADLRYKAGGGAWKTVKMKKKKGTFQATIPCQATAKTGTVRVFVRAKDSSGDPLDSYGKKADPFKISVVKETDEDPPSFPDKDAPKRCSRSAAQSESECSANDDCEEGQACVSGACKEAQTCEVTEDCSGGGKCVEGVCQTSDAPKPAGPFKTNWLGIHLAYDFAIVGGTDVCTQEAQRERGFACFYADTEEQYRFNPQPGLGNKLSSGLAPATYRVLVSYDRAFGANVTLGGRLGYAFNGGPATGKDKEVKFLPYHLEARLSYWFGNSPLGQTGFRPYVGVSAGAAQVDAKLPVTVGDCGGAADGSAPSTPSDKSPKDAFFSSACSKGQLPAGQTAAPLKLDVYKKLGQGFLGIHMGIAYAITANGAFQLNLNVMQMLPTSGQVIEPSLGYLFGF